MHIVKIFSKRSRKRTMCCLFPLPFFFFLCSFAVRSAHIIPFAATVCRLQQKVHAGRQAERVERSSGCAGVCVGVRAVSVVTGLVSVWRAAVAGDECLSLVQPTVSQQQPGLCVCVCGGE